MRNLSVLLFLVLTVACIQTASAKTPPVSFGNVTSQLNGANLDITWITQAEANNDYFVIERSTDSLNFSVIGTISGTGNSSNILNYTFTDNTVLPGEDYCYCIKQVDFDGSFSYSSQTCYQMTLGLDDQQLISN